MQFFFISWSHKHKRHKGNYQKHKQAQDCVEVYLSVFDIVPLLRMATWPAHEIGGLGAKNNPYRGQQRHIWTVTCEVGE